MIAVLSLSSIQSYPTGGVSQLQFKTFFPASSTGEKLAEVVFRILDQDNGGTIGFPEIQKVTEILINNHS